MRRAGLLLVLLALPALGTPFSWPSPYRLQDSFDSPAHPGLLARYLTPSGSTVSFSGVTFARSSAGAACTAADGSVTFPASGVPCLAGGYHARPQIADLATNTAALDNAAWTKSNATVTANSAAAPDGTTTADTVTSTSAGGYVQQAFTSTGGAFSCSGYAQALTGTQDYAVVAYDVTGAAALKTTACTATTAWPLRSDLRCSASVSSTVSGHSIACRLYPGGTAGTGSVYAWGLQPEWSAFPNDYCPSGSTPATCAAEVATVPTPSGMSLTSGCSKVCITPGFTGAETNVGTSVFLSASTSASNYLAYNLSGDTVLRTYDGTHIATVAGALVAGQRSCFLTTWSAAGNSLRIDNLTSGTQGTAQSFTTLSALSTVLGLGSRASGVEQSNAILDSIVIGSSPGACQ